MAHMVDRMIYSGQVPWHGLGIKLPETCDSDTLRNLVFDWHVYKRPVFAGETAAERATATTPPSYGFAPGWNALTRSDNGALLSIMPNSYSVVEYADALALLDAASEKGETKYITAGTLDEGRRGWALATIPSESREVAGAEVMPYLLLSTSHDGTQSLRVMFTPVYVVCNNTLTAALRSSKLSNTIVLHHTKNVTARLTEAETTIREAREYFGAFHAQALRFAAIRLGVSAFTQITERLFSDIENEPTDTVLDARRTCLALFRGEQRARDNAPGTKWAALNALTEYIDHYSVRRTVESRFKAVLFNDGARLRQKAFDLLLAA